MDNKNLMEKFSDQELEKELNRRRIERRKSEYEENQKTIDFINKKKDQLLEIAGFTGNESVIRILEKDDYYGADVRLEINIQLNPIDKYYKPNGNLLWE